jgi:hypothetical protein
MFAASPWRAKPERFFTPEVGENDPDEMVRWAVGPFQVPNAVVVLDDVLAVFFLGDLAFFVFPNGRAVPPFAFPTCI